MSVRTNRENESNSSKSYYVEKFDPNDDTCIPKTPSPEVKSSRKKGSEHNESDEPKHKKIKSEKSDDNLSKRVPDSPFLYNVTFGGSLNKFKEGEIFQSSFLSSPSIMNQPQQQPHREREPKDLPKNKEKLKETPKTKDLPKPSEAKTQEFIVPAPKPKVPATDKSPKNNNHAKEFPFPVVTKYDPNPELSFENLKLLEVLKAQQENIKVIIDDLKKCNEKVIAFRKDLENYKKNE